MRPSHRHPIVPILAAAVLGCGGGEAASGVAQIRNGDPVPAYAAADLQGDTLSLEGLRGSVVLLNIWATWCIPCREELPALAKLHEQRARDGLRIVAVSIDGGSVDVGGFAQDFGVGFTVLHDPQSRVTRTFRTIGVPETFLIDRDGIIVKRWIGAFDPTAEDNARLIEDALAS